MDGRIYNYQSGMARFLLSVILCVFAVRLSAASFPEMFAERAKCFVVVKYIIEMEEDRRQLSTSGMLADADGLVMLPSTEIPDISPKCLKDFKAYSYGGKEEGYEAEFLGADKVSGVKFLRIKGELPDCMKPYTVFGRAKFEVGQYLWGTGALGEEFSYEPYCLRSYVSCKGRRPLDMGMCNSPVSGVGGGVFDDSGNFVGWALNFSSEERLIVLPNGSKAKIDLLENRASTFLSADELDAIVKRVPENPSGDPRGWLGIVGIQTLKKEVANFLGLKDGFGLVVSDIITNSPAAKAGLQKGDIIIGLNGKPLERLNSDAASRDKFTMDLRKTKPGDKITLELVVSNGERRSVPVVMGESPRDSVKAEFRYFKRLGFSVMESTMSEALARRMLGGLTDFPVVRFVKPNSPASSASPAALVRGDMIREINSKPIKGYAEAVSVLSKINDDNSVKELVILAEDYRETKMVKIKLD